MRARAFTLVETMVAIVLLIALSGSVMAFFWNSLDRRDTLLEISGDLRAGTLLVERLEGDLLTAIAGDQRGEAGIRGDRTSVRVVSRGVRPVFGDVPADRALGDAQGMAVRFEKGAGRVVLRRWSGDDPGSSADEVIAERVAALRVRYFDGRTWRASFDSKEAGDLPVALEVALWFRRPGESLPEGEAEDEDADVWGDDSWADGWPDDELMGEVFGGDWSDEPDTWDEPSSTTPQREPDRLRVIVVPDGPGAAWRDLR